MFDKIKNSKIKKHIKLLNDSRVLGLFVFGIIALLVTWSGIKTIQTNYELQKQIGRLEQENQIKRLENENLRLKNKYFETDEFLDLAARRQFGMAAPGEKVLLVPKNVALARAPNAVVSEKRTDEESKKPTYQKNLEAWLDFFLNR